MAGGRASRGGGRWQSVLLALAVLAVGVLLAGIGGSILASTLHDRARVEGECTVIDRRPVYGRFGGQAFDRADLRVRLDLGGSSYVSRGWVRFVGSRPEIGSKVVCYHDVRDPEDIDVYPGSFGGEISLTLFGALFAVVGLVLLLAVLDADVAWRRAKSSWRRMRRARRRAVVASPDAGEDPYRAAAPHSVRQEDERPSLPPLSTSPGTVLAVGLRGSEATGGGRAPALAGVGCTSVPMLFMISVLVSDERPMVGVALWAVCVAAVVFFPLAVARRRTRGVPVVEVDREPALLGSPLELHVEISGPAEVDAMVVEIECRSGEDVQLELWAVPTVPAEGRHALARGQTWASDWRLALPERPDLRFEAKEELRWQVLVRRTLGSRERVARYPIRVLARA